jgi:DNA polymerase-4
LNPDLRKSGFNPNSKPEDYPLTFGFVLVDDGVMQPTIALLDLDAFFASVEQALNPSLKNKPVIVCRVDPQGGKAFRGIVSAASYEARKFGVHSGMAAYQAKRLAPNAIYVDGSYHRYSEFSKRVFKIAARYCPHIEVVSVDEGFLDFTDCQLLYTEVKKEVDITASIGLASSRVVAKVAADFGKPDGLTVVPVGEEKKFLAPLPIRDLPGIGHQTEKKLKAMGIDRLGQIATLPEKEVIKLFGKFGHNLWLGSNGISNIRFDPRGVQKGVSRSRTFSENSNDLYFVKGMLRFLTEKVAGDLREKGFRASLVYACIRDKHFNTIGRQRQLSYYTNHARDIYQIAEELVFELWDCVTPLRLLGVGTSNFEGDPDHIHPNQLGLFDGADQKSQAIDQAVDKLRDKYGFFAVQSAQVFKINQDYNSENREQSFSPNQPFQSNN